MVLEEKDILYRYRTFSNYTISAIYQNKLSFTTLSEMNDEMEGYFNFSREKVLNAIRDNVTFQNKIVNEINKKMCFGHDEPYIFDDLSHSSTHEYKVKYMFDPKNKDKLISAFDSLINELFRKIRNSFYIASFSKSGGHPVMWSHYASFSKGFVELYNRNEISSTISNYVPAFFSELNRYQQELINIHEVRYQEYPDSTDFVVWALIHDEEPLEYVKSEETLDNLLNILLTKMKIWEYEAEERIIIPRFKGNESNFINELDGRPFAICIGKNVSFNNFALALNMGDSLNIDIDTQVITFDIAEKRTMKYRTLDLSKKEKLLSNWDYYEKHLFIDGELV